VFIIDEVHMLSTQAFNAFLKTLEEPPAHAIFILATTEKHKILPTILSRCQIYDFQRMSIENTVQHLVHVAKQEGYSYEPEALNVIARKADGGMRDALSIFDQVVSYTGGNITYQHVIENLNVLDYDYYFRLVGLMLEKKISECMLLYNEILNKGFDGGPFISGLANHLRDLLVSRDPQTTQLLEASDDIRKRYAEQAQRCKPQWLYRAIRLCNECDLAYRNSRNKRLQVELTLIEAAQATDDDASAGRRPVRILKPIFSLLTTAAAASKAPGHDNAQATAAVQQQPTAQPLPEQTAQPAPSPQPRYSAQPKSTGSNSLPPTSATKKRLSLNLKTMTPTLGHLRSKGTANTPEETPTTVAEPTSPVNNASASEEQQPFTLDQVQVQWQSFIQSLPVDDTALAQNMRIMRPQIDENDPTAIILQVENEDISNMMQPKFDDLLKFMRAQLHNSRLTITCQIVEREQPPVRVYDKREQLRHFCDLNPQLITLGKTFKLELI